MSNHKYVLIAILEVCLIFCTPLYAGSLSMYSQFHIFREFNHQSIINSAYIHPLLEGGSQNYIAWTAQEKEILKVAFYYDKPLSRRAALIYTYNPSQRNFAGMPARYISDGARGGILFADGTKLYSYFPPDARPLGTPERMYELRWRRVYKNYYFVTLFRGSGEAVEEDLMTEKDGKDLTPVLGDTSENRDFKRIGGSLGGDMELEQMVEKDGRTTYVKYNLIPVYEKDLPPDFPEGVVCWLP